jgi:uncharacterized RDD family membrane protein YckC
VSDVGAAARMTELAERRRKRLARTRSLQGRRAGFVSRLLANVVDAVVVLIFEIGIYLLVAVVRFLVTRHFHFVAPGREISGLVFWGLALVYLTSAWASTGKTYGKQLTGLRAVRPDGHPLTGWQAFGRALLYLVFLPGFAWVLFDRRNRSVQDLIVRSSVVYDWAYRALGV